MVLTAFKQFSATVRELDDRLITTGNSLPRSQAEHMRLQFGSWDSRADFMNNLELVNPFPSFQLASIHLYHSDVTKPRFSASYRSSYDELLSLASQGGHEVDMPIFVGEFGASDVLDGGTDVAIHENQQIIDAIVRNHVPLSAAWVFDYSPQESQGWNITFTNGRAPILQAIVDANRSFQQGACTAR
jgi:hypothetical protein